MTHVKDELAKRLVDTPSVRYWKAGFHVACPIFMHIQAVRGERKGRYMTRFKGWRPQRWATTGIKSTRAWLWNTCLVEGEGPIGAPHVGEPWQLHEA